MGLNKNIENPELKKKREKDISPVELDRAAIEAELMSETLEDKDTPGIEDENPKPKVQEPTSTEQKFNFHSELQINKSEITRIKCRNEHLEGMEHPETGIPFKRKQFDIDGKQYEVVVPEFRNVYDTKISKDMYEATDREQFKKCNLQLKNEVSINPVLREHFDDDQLEQIDNGDTPDGYTWHHDAEAGIIQLMDTEIHQKTGHTGGRSIWGGGTYSR